MVVLDLDLLPQTAKIRSERGIPCYFVLDENCGGSQEQPHHRNNNTHLNQTHQRQSAAPSDLSLDLPRPTSPPGGSACRKVKRNYLLVLRRRRERLRRLQGTDSVLPGFKKGDSMLCCGRQKDQGRDIPPHAEPAASPRRLQFGQIASTLPHQSHQLQQQHLQQSQHQQQLQGVGRGRELPPMVLQQDFRKVSGISSEVFKQLEAVENDHDATTAAALDAVERRGEMLVRMLDPRNQFSRSRQDLVRRFVSMQDGVHTVHFVEIVKRPGQTLGLYIREGNGFDRYDGVFISRIAIESAVFNSGCLGVGDEILAVNLIDVTRMSLDDVVIIMSIPRRLVLTIRQQKGQRTGTGSLLRPDSAKPPPVVVIKKELEEENFEESTDENNHMGHGPHSFSLSHSMGSGIGRGRMSAEGGGAGMMTTQGQRLYAQQMHRERAQGHGLYGPHAGHGPVGPIHPTSIQSLPRYPTAYQHYANFSQIQMNHSQLPDVTDYTPRIGRQEEFRLGAAQSQLRKAQYSDYFDPNRPEPPPRPSTGQGTYASPAQYDWYGSAGSHGDRYHHPQMDREPPGPSNSYQPPPPVITEQPRSINMPAHFQSFDRAYPKTLESLAEKVHTFYTGPRPVRQGARSQVRMPRTGSDHRLSLGRTTGSLPPDSQQQWYGSMPRQRPSAIDYRAHPLSIQPPRYAASGAGMSSRLAAPLRRKPVLDYASDSEAMTYAPSLRSTTGLSIPAATRRSLGLTNGRSNSLPRDFVRGGRTASGSGRKSNLRFDKRGLIGDLTSSASMSGRRALLLASALDSQDESDSGATSAPEMQSSRKDRDYRAWLTRAPSTSAIYERLKTNRDVELLQTQRAAKFNYSAENLSILDRARQRTEREIKRLHEDIDRENQAHAQLSAWEASQAAQQQQVKDQPSSYYASPYRPHVTPGSTLTGGDSTLARALAGRSPSASSALASLGLRETLTTSASFTKDSLSAETLTRLGLSTSRSRDLLSADGRTTPTSALLHRLTAAAEHGGDKDSDSGLRKEILNRSLLSREFLSREPLMSLDEKTADQRGRLISAHSALNAGRGSGSSGSGSGTGQTDSRLKLLTINPSEFIRYKIERPSSAASDSGGGLGGGSALHGHSGILRVHLLAGRALRSTVRTTDASVRTRDLYCVLECDRVHKARTVVCTGDQNFDWDETFELDLVNNKELDFLIYSWDPQLRHRLCYKGSVNLVQILSETNPVSAFHQLAIKVEPRGTLYVKLKHTPPQEAFRRELKKVGIFGADLGNVVMREDSGLNVPLLVQKCIEEIERRGLDIIGLYRLCGSATKKQILREAFERSPRTVDLSAENVPDINVIAGVLKDYLRELPEPLLTKCLYQMLVDALSVCLPDDPEGNARLLFSIIECLPKPNRCTLLMIVEHLSLVCSLSDRNKMGPTQLATCFGPILMIYFDQSPDSLDFQPPIKVLQYLLEVWPAKSVRSRVSAFEVVPPPPQQQQTPTATTQAQYATPFDQVRKEPEPPQRYAYVDPERGQGHDDQRQSQSQEYRQRHQSHSQEEQRQGQSQERQGQGQERQGQEHHHRQPHPLPEGGATKSRDPKAQPIPPSPFPIRRFSGPGPGHVERRHSIEERERRRLPSLPTQPPQHPHPLMHQYSLPAVLPQKAGNGPPPSEHFPPPLPLDTPEPEQKTNGHGHAHGQDEASSSTAQTQQSKQAPLPPPKPKSKSGSVDSISGGSTSTASSAGASPPQSNSNGSASSSPSWATTVAPSSLKNVSGVENGQAQSPGTPAKVTSPTPASTPPPVPPRLDRRPSQPSPTSSPPAMPPPVPPRLGRAAPVRTPSLDSREAFEVDCYTIKEENGEEDYLT